MTLYPVFEIGFFRKWMGVYLPKLWDPLVELRQKVLCSEMRVTKEHPWVTVPRYDSNLRHIQPHLKEPSDSFVTKIME